MKRQPPSTESLVYAYGCGEPTAGLQHAEVEQERCGALWDRLVGIERDCDQEIIAAAAADVPAIAAAHCEQQAALRDMRAAGDDAAARKAARGRLIAAERALWPLLADWRRANKPTLQELEQRRRSRVAAARRASPAWWPNYNAVIQRYDTARIETRRRGRRLRERDLSRDDGCLTLQIQRTRSGLGAAPHELQDGTVRALQIGAVPAGAYDPAVFRGERDRLCQVTLEMRVDTAGHMLRLPVWMHRPLPADARIKAAQLVWHREAGGPRRWGLRLTISRPRQEVEHDAPGVAAVVRIGAAMAGSHLRVAACETTGGAAPPIAPCGLDAHWLAMMDRVAVLQGIERDDDAPRVDRIRARMERPGLLARLLRRRREIYRLWARAVAQAHGSIRVETPALSELAYTGRGSDANALRHRACAHQLVAELQHQARKAGARVEIVVAAPDASAPVPRRVRRRRNNELPTAARAEPAALAQACAGG